MVELVDTPDLGSGVARHVGSSPILGIFPRTFQMKRSALFLTTFYKKTFYSFDLESNNRLPKFWIFFGKPFC